MSHYRKRDHRDPARRDRYHTLSQRDRNVHALIKATLNQWRAPRPRVPKTSVFDNPGIGLSARDIANNLSHRRGGDFGASESRGISAADAARTALRMPLVDVQAPQDPCGGGA